MGHRTLLQIHWSNDIMPKQTNNLLTIGAVLVIGYFAYKLLTGNNPLSGFGIGGGGTDTGGVVGGDTGDTGDDPNKKFKETIRGPAKPGMSQTWLGGVYGGAGQPSLNFAVRTYAQAQHLAERGGNYTASERAVMMAGAGISAGAPPRMVAKMKAGKVY
jgi:hypothetical protein